MVANSGLSEVLGDILLTVTAACGSSTDTFCVSKIETIQIRFTNVTIDNSVATGIRICETVGGSFLCNQDGNLVTGAVTVSSDTISIAVKQGVNLAAGDRLTIAGVRARIASSVLLTPGTEANAVVSATPAAEATFPPDTLVVARSADPLSLQVSGVPEIPCEIGDATPIVIVREGFNAAFVDYGDTAERSFPGQPLLPRPQLGGNTNTRVRLVLSGLGSSVGIQWPVTVAAVNSNAVLALLSQTLDGTTATYIYGTPDQLQSDQISETFAVRLNPASFIFSGSNPLTGIVSIQGQVLPPANPANFRPRFNHPLEPDPGLIFFLLKRCTTPTTSTGTAQVLAKAGELPWTGTLNYRLVGPVLFTGNRASDSVAGLPVGSYTANYLSGGPAGATFASITPANVRELSTGGTVDYTFNFTGPTIANLELTAAPLTLCASASTAVASFQLVNRTGDVQIIPAGAALTFTFSHPIDALPSVTGLGTVSTTSTPATVTYQLSDALSLPPGGAVTFSGTRLNMNGIANGQNATVQLTSAPSSAVQLPSDQLVLGTTTAPACIPVVNLSVTPATIQLGQSATLQWSTQNTTGLDLQPGVGSVPLQGSLTVSPSVTTTYVMTAQGPKGTGQASVVLTVTPAPKFSSSGVINAASLVPGLVAGSIGTIIGMDLSNVSGFVQATTVPLPAQLAGTSVRVNGIAAPLFAIGSTSGQQRIDFQVPWEIAGQSSATLVVKNNTLESDPVQLTPLDTLPGIFTAGGTAGAIVHSTSGAMVTATNPAFRGEVVVIYATGLGSVTFPPATGAATLSDPPSVSTPLPIVTVGGVTAPVIFSGLAPGFVGLYQVRVQVPPNAPSGSQDVVIQAGGRSSNSVKIAIQ
ncbi:MAG: hypothetical protein HY651_12265 [Acidobacteria bacterium]|nr:hypothetical protein [Acidobacteriota bacterium]